MPIAAKSAPSGGYAPPPAKKTAPKQGTAAAPKILTLSAEDMSRRANRTRTLNEFRDLVSGALSVFGLDADAGAVRHHSAATIGGLVEYAETNEKFATWVDGGDQVSPILMVIASCLALGTQVAVNHRLFGMKAENFANIGVVSPETLVSENRTAMMAAQQKAMEAEMRQKQQLMMTVAAYQETAERFAAMEEYIDAMPDDPDYQGTDG